MNEIDDFIRELAEMRVSDTDHVFPTYSNWLNKRLGNQWETYNVSSAVADFGTVQWERRPLDAIIVKTVVMQKNRILGKYDTTCFMFGVVDDAEFQMRREPFAVDCNDVSYVNKWEIGKSFKSQWNVK